MKSLLADAPWNPVNGVYIAAALFAWAAVNAAVFCLAGRWWQKKPPL